MVQQKLNSKFFNLGLSFGPLVANCLNRIFKDEKDGQDGVRALDVDVFRNLLW